MYHLVFLLITAKILYFARVLVNFKLFYKKTNFLTFQCKGNRQHYTSFFIYDHYSPFSHILL